MIAVPSMVPENEKTVVVVDEIGKMECFSELFRKTLLKVLESVNPVVGSISLKGDKYLDTIKKRSDTLLLPVSKKNRDNMVEEFFARKLLTWTSRK